MRTFQISDARSHKFWQIEVSRKSFTVTYGKVGTAGQTQTKTFPTPQKAREEADKLVREKLKKGYAETTPKANVSTGVALEAAIRANPDDRAAHAAYADYLTERGDPRGEFIQVQLALEDEVLPAADRKKLQAREKELLRKHEREWVGAWADVAPGPAVARYDAGLYSDPTGGKKYEFERGLLAAVNFGRLTVVAARAFAKAPETRMVRRLFVGLVVHDEADDIRRGEAGGFEPGPDIPADAESHHAQYPLMRWPYLRNVRRFGWGWPPARHGRGGDFRFNSNMTGDHVADFVKQMPDIEELLVFAHVQDARRLVALPMPRLRVFQLYHAWSYPLDRLAANKTVGSLTAVLCHPHGLEYDDEPYIRLKHLRALCRARHLTNLRHLQLRAADFGDEGAEEIVASGVLKRLKVLELQLGCVSDEGAKVLAACPDLTSLELLDLSHNALTKTGIRALRATGVNLVAGHMHDETRYDPDGDNEFLYHGDAE